MKPLETEGTVLVVQKVSSSDYLQKSKHPNIRGLTIGVASILKFK